MRLRLHSDPQGFLSVSLGRSKKLLSFTPITKLQFEEYLATCTELGDAWYSEILAVAPRQPWHAYPEISLLPLLITGIWPQEITGYTKWLGTEMLTHSRLPTAVEWKRVYRIASQSPILLSDIRQLDRLKLAPAAHHIQSTLLRQAQCAKQTWAQAMRMSGGGFDYVLRGTECLALGAPTSVLNPLKDPPRRIPPDRDPLFGFRLVYEPS